jgi:regulator of ribosome biosynthesis
VSYDLAIGWCENRENSKKMSSSSSSSSSSSGLLKGSDIAPTAFDTSIPGPDDPDKVDDLQYDLHHMVATDSQPVDEDIKQLSIIARNERLLASARDNAQLLFNRLFQLDKQDSNEGLLAVLPDTDIQDPGSVESFLPRFRPVPTKKKSTRWEQFANEKGIKNRKRDRMVWDEQSQSMKPRWGYGRANDDTKDWAIPVGANDDPYENPFEKRKMAKKERVLKNQLKQMSNMDRNMGMKTSHGLKSNLVGREKNLGRVKGSGGGSGGDKKRSRHGLGGQTREAIVDTQRSDASMGKFGRLNSGEKKADRGGRRRQYASVAPRDASTERNMAQSVVDKLLGKQTKRVGRVITRDNNDVSGAKKGGGVDSNFHNGDQRKRKRGGKGKGKGGDKKHKKR